MISTIEPLGEIIEAQLGQWPQGSALAGKAVNVLLEAAFFGQRGMQRRRPVIAGDGTPILLSFQEDGRGQTPPFRLLTEPGLSSLSVSEQIDFSLRTLDRLLSDLCWSGCAGVANDVVRALFPSRADAVDSWWGGMGIGLSLDTIGLELRIYCNVREGDVPRRWSRIVAVLAQFGATAASDAPLRAFIERTSPHAVPAGLALCMREGRPFGIRIYLSVSQPDADAICSLGALDIGAKLAVAGICNAYPTVRPFTYGCVTVAYDFPFAIEQLYIDPIPVRFKADFDCTPHPQQPCGDRETMALWLAARHSELGLPSDRMRAFLADIQRACGGYATDYVSFGWRRGAPEITTYVLPSGYATLP